MSQFDHYIKAATRDNTRRSYRSAIDHFEVTWGGFLPATADTVANYLATYAPVLAINTLRQRVAALSHWHLSQGMPDPTKAPIIAKVLRGIQALHPAPAKQAKPLQILQLEQVDSWFAQQITEAIMQEERSKQLTYSRDRALILLGFWRGFRSDELSRIQIEHIQVVSGEGMNLFLPYTKTNRHGHTYKVPALSRLCPVTAYQDWIHVAELSSGPVFRGINRWGQISKKGMHSGSVIPLLRKMFTCANIPSSDSYSSHSLRRGFASWANACGWDIKALMDYVGWKDIRSAARYIQSDDPFEQHRISTALNLPLQINRPDDRHHKH